MTLNQIETFLQVAQKREIGGQVLRGYFLEEMHSVGIAKSKLKKLVKQKRVIHMFHKQSKTGQLRNFYYVED